MIPLYTTDLDALRKEVEIHTLRGTGPGGQHRNKVESAVRIVHLPSGITVVAAEHRLQGRNRELGFRRLQERLIEKNRRPKPRIRTKPSRTAVQKRLENKRRQAQKKNQRRRISLD